MVRRLAQDKLHALRCVLLDEHRHLVVVVMVVRGHDQLGLSGGKEDRRRRGIGGCGRLDVIVGRCC